MAQIQSRVIAVLTGDLVDSRQARPTETDAAMHCLRGSAQDLADLTDGDTRFTRFRGDGWQIVIGQVGWVLRACLILLADLRASGIGLQTRISAGVGRTDTLGTTDLSDGSGRAFFVSGDHLERMSRQRRLVIAGGRQQDSTWQAAIFDLVDWQSSQWTAAQAQAVSMALRQNHRTHHDMAEKLGITRQALQARLASAGYSALSTPLAAFEQFDWNADA